MGVGTKGPEVRTWLPRPVATAYRSADKIINNSNVLVDDGELLFAVGVNEIWQFYIFLLCISSAVADIKFAITVPAGGNAYIISHMQIGGTTGTVPMNPWFATQAITVDGNAANRVAILQGLVINGANAGDVNLQWAQNVAEVSDTKVLLGSSLVAHRVG